LPFNTNANETHGSFTFDKQKIYFSSDRAGGYGGYDIYEVEYLESGKWSIPRNLGPHVNTSANEISPFIMSDGLTLFFSRNLSADRNDFDIFYTTIRDDGSIDVAENLGDSINSHCDDVCIHVNYNNYNAIFVAKNLNSYYLNEFNL
jgi:Tol biopolymer transport system component